MEIEKTIIAELIHTNYETRIDAIIELEKVEFEDHVCKSLFQTIRDLTLLRKDVDSVSVYHANQETPLKEISDICNLFTSDVYLLSHIEILKDKKYKLELTKLIDKHNSLIKTGTNSIDLDEMRNGLIADLSALSRDDKAEFENISEYKKQIEAQMNSNKSIEGYSWGISDLDLWTSGIVLPRVYVIGGLKKSGKTRFLIHTIKALHQQQTPTVFLSMEMPAYEVTKLLHASFTGLNDLRFRASSMLKSEEMQAFRNVEIDEQVFSLECKSGLKIDQVLSRIRRYAKMGFKVIMIDYLQRISHDRNRQAQELEDISIRLADASRQHNVALILLSQLNAMGERETPNMGHLKGCVEENTLIDGTPIKEYYKNNIYREVSSYDTQTQSFVNRIPSDIIDSGEKQCYRITTETGKEIIVSGTTKLFTDKNKWEDVSDIEVGMKIGVVAD